MLASREDEVEKSRVGVERVGDDDVESSNVVFEDAFEEPKSCCDFVFVRSLRLRVEEELQPSTNQLSSHVSVVVLNALAVRSVDGPCETVWACPEISSMGFVPIHAESDEAMLWSLERLVSFQPGVELVVDLPKLVVIQQGGNSAERVCTWGFSANPCR